MSDDADAPDPKLPPPVRYRGPAHGWIFAGVSLFGTTSVLASALVDEGPLPGPLRDIGGCFLAGFFLFSMLASLLGLVTLWARTPGEDLGSLCFGRWMMPKRGWIAVLLVCYLAPWAFLAGLAVILNR